MRLQLRLYSFIQKKLGIKSRDEGILLKGSSQAFIIKVLGLIVAYGLQVLLARTLGVEHYGEYVYVLTWANLIGLFTKLGFDGASKKILPAYNAQKKDDHFKSYVLYASKVSFIICISLFVLGGGYLIFDTSLTQSLKNTFLVGFILVIIITQLGLITAFLEGVREVIKSMIPLYFIRPILIGAGVIIFYKINYPLTAAFAMLLNVAATFVATFVIWILFKPYISKSDNETKIERSEKKEWRRIAYSLLLVSGTIILLTETDTIMLGMLDSTTTAGVYQTAIKIGHLAMFGFNSIEMIIAPTIAGLYATRKFPEIQNILSKGVLLMMIFTFPMIFILWFFGDSFLNLYGVEFLDGFNSLKILLACQVINVITGSALNLMIMTKYENQALYILASALVLNIILNVVLIPIYGMEGAALATGVTLVIWNLAIYIFIRKRIKMDPSILGLLTKSKVHNLD